MITILLYTVCVFGEKKKKRDIVFNDFNHGVLSEYYVFSGYLFVRYPHKTVYLISS